MESLLQNKWVLLSGVAVIAVGAYFYMSSSAAPAATDNSAAGLIPSGSYAPASFDAAGGAITQATSPSQDPNAYIDSLINLQQQQGTQNYNLGMAQVAAQQAIGLAQTSNDYTLGMAGIQSQNESTVASLFAPLIGDVGKGKGKNKITGVYGDFGIDPLTGTTSFFAGDVSGASAQASPGDLGGTSVLLGGTRPAGVAQQSSVNTGASTGGFNAPATSSSGGRAVALLNTLSGGRFAL